MGKRMTLPYKTTLTVDFANVLAAQSKGDSREIRLCQDIADGTLPRLVMKGQPDVLKTVIGQHSIFRPTNRQIHNNKHVHMVILQRTENEHSIMTRIQGCSVEGYKIEMSCLNDIC